eukprot:15438127-Alexandrium_andersonii.AAC.1
MSARDLITDSDRLLPVYDINSTGWVCKNNSRQSTNRNQFATCMLDAVGQSGTTFNFLLNHLKHHEPVAVVGETVRRSAAKTAAVLSPCSPGGPRVMGRFGLGCTLSLAQSDLKHM